MKLSPSLLAQTLIQPSIPREVQVLLAAEFRLGGPGWRHVELLQLPANIPDTKDPIVLALRRRVTQDSGDLRAMHRIALENAAEKPQGLAVLALEEIASRLRDGLLVESEFFQVFAALFLTVDSDEMYRPESSDIGARVLVEIVRYYLSLNKRRTVGDLLERARLMAARGTLDSELEIYCNETQALLLAASNRWDTALKLWLSQIERLLQYSVPDRAAESLADLTDLLSRHGKRACFPPRRIFEAASQKLAELPMGFNRKLRSRFLPTFSPKRG